MPSNRLILCCPLLLPSIFPSIRVFSSESVLCIRWPKYWSFSFSISSSSEYSGLISFRIDWFDLAVQGTLKSLLQHHSSKASVLRHPAFFIVQLSHSYMMTGRTIALTRWMFVGKVMSLLFNMLSRFVISFLPKSKSLLISWLQSPSTVILGPKKLFEDLPYSFTSWPISLCDEEETSELGAGCWEGGRKWEGLGTALWSGSSSAEVGGSREPRRSALGAGEEGLGWTGSAGLCSAHRQAPPTSPPPLLWSLTLHTVHLRHQASTLVVSPPQELPQRLWLCLLLALYPLP